MCWGSQGSCGGRTGFWWCQVALVAVAYVLALASCYLEFSGVSWSCCLWLWLVPPASLCVSTPGIPVLFGRNLVMESCGTGQVQGVDRTGHILYLGVCWFLCPDASGWDLLGPRIWAEWWSHPCSQLCQHSWEISSLQAGFVNGDLWHRVNSSSYQNSNIFIW